ncbi:hypothetical protein Tco_1483638 [Tanacetum coccineum]
MDFVESSEKGRRIREGSQNSSAGVSPVRYHTSSRRPRVQDHLRYNDGSVFNRLSHRKESVPPENDSVDTYSPEHEQGLDETEQASMVPSILEVAPPVETAPDTEITSATLKSRTMVSTPPKGLGPSTEDPLETDVDPGARGDGEKTNLHHPADLKAAPVTRAIGSQEIKGARR